MKSIVDDQKSTQRIYFGFSLVLHTNDAMCIVNECNWYVDQWTANVVDPLFRSGDFILSLTIYFVYHSDLFWIPIEISKSTKRDVFLNSKIFVETAFVGLRLQTTTPEEQLPGNSLAY